MRVRLIAILAAGAVIAALAAPAAFSAADLTPPLRGTGLLPTSPAVEGTDGLATAVRGAARDSIDGATGTVKRVKDTLSGNGRGSEDRGARPRERQAARTAASNAVQIRDFSYRPETITVSVGDTVEWTNLDQAPHDADAFDGSFDTPVLEKGESASVSFDEPGSFKYFCSVHPPEQFPNFTGRVKVVGSGSGPGTGGGGEGSSGSGGGGAPGGGTGVGEGAGGTSTVAGTDPSGGSSGSAGGGSGSDSDGSRLASTGHQVLPLAIAGVMLIALGAGLFAPSTLARRRKVAAKLSR